MKIIHTGDLHLGLENYGKQDPATLTNSRVLDFLRSLDYLILETISRKADLLLITGDIYHQREPNIFIQHEFSKRLIRLSDNNIPVVLLIGNHDSMLAIKHISSLQIFSELRVPNLTVIDEPKMVQVETKSGPVQIAGIPFLEPATLREYAINHKLEENQKMDLLDTVFARLIDGFVKDLDPKIPCILSAHLTLREAIYQNWRPAMIGTEIYLSEKTLRRKGFSYVALGHIHKSQIFGTDKHLPKAAYPGSLDVLDFGEAEFDHGFLSVELEKNSADLTFCPVPGQRKLVSLTIEGDSEEDIIKKVKKALISGAYENDILRITIATNASIDEQKLRRDFSDYCYMLASIRYERAVEKKTRIKDLSNENSPLDSLKQYLQVQEDPFLVEHQSQIIELTSELLKELEI
jgi:exonuclease SbcD